MKDMSRFTLSALCVLALAGCASTPRQSDAVMLARYQAFAGEPVSSIPYSTTTAATGFTTVDDEHVLLTARPGQAWLLKLSGPCLMYDRGSPSLMVTSNMGRIQSGFDRVGSLRQPGLTCIIREIRPVDMQAMRGAREHSDGNG